MNTKFDWKEWLQISSNVAILIGIVFVYMEIQQNQTLTRAQLAAEGIVMRANRANSLLGESPEVVLTKACLQPDELTTTDKIVLSQIFQSRLAEAQRNRRINLESDIGISYENSFRIAMRAIFNYEYGRELYIRFKENLTEDEDLVEIAESEFASNRESDCAKGSAVLWGF